MLTPQLAIVAQSMPAGTIFAIRFLPGSTTRPTFDMPYTLMTRAHPIMPLFVRPVGPLQQGQPLVWDMKVHEAPVVRSRGALDLRKGDQLFPALGQPAMGVQPASPEWSARSAQAPARTPRPTEQEKTHHNNNNSLKLHPRQARHRRQQQKETHHEQRRHRCRHHSGKHDHQSNPSPRRKRRRRASAHHWPQAMSQSTPGPAKTTEPSVSNESKDSEAEAATGPPPSGQPRQQQRATTPTTTAAAKHGLHNRARKGDTEVWGESGRRHAGTRCASTHSSHLRPSPPPNPHQVAAANVRGN